MQIRIKQIRLFNLRNRKVSRRQRPEVRAVVVQVPIGFFDHLRAGEVENHSMNKAVLMRRGAFWKAVYQLSLRVERQKKEVVIQKMNRYVGSKNGSVLLV